MLKRNIAILIAGGLLGAQAGLAAAGQDTFPSNDTEVIWKALPAQVEYFKQREAEIQREPAVRSGLSLPGVAGYATVITSPVTPQQPPTLRKYLYETRPAEIAKDPTVLRGDSFPPSADELYGKMLPALVRYFEERTVTLQARTLDVSAPLSR